MGNQEQLKWRGGFIVEFSRIKGVVIAASLENRTTDGAHYINIRIKDDSGEELCFEHVLVPTQIDTCLTETNAVDLLCYNKGRPDITVYAALISDDLVIDFGIADNLSRAYMVKRKQQITFATICIISIVGIVVSPVFLYGILSLKKTFTSIIPVEMEREEAINHAHAQVGK